MHDKNICPECGCDLRGLDREKHAIKHWGVTPKNLDRLANEEAKSRYKLVLGGPKDLSRGDLEESGKSDVEREEDDE